MGKKIDLTGKQFGEWTVLQQDLEQVGKKECAYWYCKCSCGTVKSVSSQSLREGQSKSCGCKKIKDLTGKYFGYIEVLKRDESKNERLAWWICKCHGCGKIFSLDSNRLQYKDISCGCKRYDVISEKQSAHLEGKIFGYLKVLERDLSYPRGQDAYWICECQRCKNRITVRTTDLQKGKTVSCGCINSKGETKINLLLNAMSINYISQYKLDDLRSERNVRLRFDFYLPDYNLLIEYQGPQHYSSCEYFGGEEQFNIQQKHDQAKRDYCKEHNIPLIEIPYTDYNLLNEDYMNNLLQSYKKGELNAKECTSL